MFSRYCSGRLSANSAISPHEERDQFSAEHTCETEPNQIDEAIRCIYPRAMAEGSCKKKRNGTESKGRTKKTAKRRHIDLENSDSTEELLDARALHDFPVCPQKTNKTMIDPQTEPSDATYQEFLKPNGRLGLDPLRFRLILSKDQLTIRRKGPVSDPSQSLPLSNNHGKFPFHFQFDFWIGGSLVESVRSKPTKIYSKEPRIRR